MTPAQEFLLDRLHLSAINPTQAKHAGIRALTAAEAGAQLGLDYSPGDGLLIPYFATDGKPLTGMWRFRRMRHSPGKKYTQPSETGCWVYYPRVEGLDWQKVLDNPKIEVFIVEGELKALALCIAGVPAVAIGGVWNWTRNKELLPELKVLAAGGRHLWVAFDSDAEDKPLVSAARYHLCKALLDAGGRPHVIPVPKHPAQKDGKTGADDLVRLTKLRDAKLRDYLAGLEDPEKFELAHVLYRFNAEHVLNLGTGCVHAVRNINRQWPVDTFCSVIVAPEVFRCHNADGKVVTKPAGRAWIGWKLRNTVVGRTYLPLRQDVPRGEVLYVEQDGERYVNNWRGWASVPKEDAEGVATFWTPLLDHLFQAKGYETAQQIAARLQARKYFEQWLAAPVQTPGLKLFVVACLLGNEGAGKSMVGDFLRLGVYGEHFQEIEQSALESEFNDIYTEAKSFIMGSEITSRDFNKKRGLAERLKYLVTSPSIAVNPKNKPKYNVPNRINLFLTSNYSDAFLLGNGDRRYFIWDAPDGKLPDAMGKLWVDAAWKWIESETGKAALHYHLLHLDLAGFDPHVPPPETEAKRLSQHYSENAVETWVGEFAEDPEGKTGKPDETVWRSDELWALCQTEVGDKKYYSLKTFLLYLRKHFLCVGRVIVWVHEKFAREEWKQMKTGLWMRKPVSEPGAKFPTLEEARMAWEEQRQRILKEKA